MQSVIIEGYLAADPSLLVSQASGRSRASFRLVETVRFHRADGQAGERTTGFNCVCFNERTAADYIAAYARRGARVVVRGHVENDTWTGTDGTLHFDLRLMVEDLRIKARRRQEPAASDPEPGSRPATETEDEIPF